MLYCEWSHYSSETTRYRVLPDGCRDVLIISDSNGSATRLLTDWDHQARSIELREGEHSRGFRMRPGLTVDAKELETVNADAESITSFIVSQFDQRAEEYEIIDELGFLHASLSSVSRLAGVSVRTLQRRFKAEGLPNPDYWRLLSRARRAAVALASDESLIDIANRQGYSDQSHMTRDFQRWFQISPSQLRTDEALLTQVCQPGLGAWTFEQISIKNPLGSLT